MILIHEQADFAILITVIIRKMLPTVNHARILMIRAHRQTSIQLIPIIISPVRQWRLVGLVNGEADI